MFPYSILPVQCLSLLLAAGSLLAAAESETVQREFFESKVRPLLAEHCYSCHSGQAERIEGGLRLDSASAIARGGDSGKVVAPGKVDSSLLIEAIRYDSFEMPPEGKLPDAAIATLERWVADGAYWPPEEKASGAVEEAFDLEQRRAEHWVWQPPTYPALPNQPDASSPVDALLSQAQRRADVTAAPVVDRRRLARRISFDLTGLPPSPEAVDRFVNDKRPDARTRFIDRLLADPAVGVRWGRHWLDLVRYAESRGHEFDHDVPGAYHYRDYVIRALNSDIPYDVFVTEHLAGDLLASPRLDPRTGGNESVLGTGFWHLGEWVHSPVDVTKDEADRYDNALDVFSKAFLGLTVACARCHDHKFDAISTRDYYALAGFLQSSSYRLVRFDADARNRALARQLATLDARGQQAVIRRIANAFTDRLPEIEHTLKRIVAGDLEADATDADLAALYRAAKEDRSHILWPLTQRRVAKPAAETWSPIVDFATLSPSRFYQNGYSFGSKPIRAGDIVWGESVAEPVGRIAAAALVRRDPLWKGLVNEVPPRKNFKNKVDEAVRAGKVYRTPTFTVQQDTLAYRVRGKGRVFLCVGSHRLVFGPLHGNTVVAFDVPVEGEAEWVTQSVARYRGQRAHLEFEPTDDAPLEIYALVQGDAVNAGWRQTFAAPDSAAAVEALMANLADALRWWVSDERDSTDAALAKFYGRHLGWLWRNRAALLGPSAAQLAFEEAAEIVESRRAIGQQIVRRSRVAPALLDGSGEDQPLYIRGNSGRPSDLVPRRGLAAMGGEPVATQVTGSGRLRLANELIGDENPTLDRVLVNRVWHHLFGTGLVPTTDDFGVLGQRPSRPQVLDALALDFRRQGRSIKRAIRDMMHTDIYARHSVPEPASMKRDPTNTNWHYRPVRRLEGEAIRDSLLFLAGNLDRTMGGPSVPIHLTAFMDGRGRPQKNGPADGAGRRSIYLEVRRNFLSPFMLAFDTPSPFSAMGRRNRSNVPAQALILQNNPFVQQQAADWAGRAAGHDLSTDERIVRLYREAFSREPNPNELQAARQFVADGGADRWTALAHVLVNVKEFIFVY